jgi:hypothetical protein
MANHKWHDVLIAIAEGREVEFKVSAHSAWESSPDVNPLNDLAVDWEWRVKPVPVIRYEWLQKANANQRYVIYPMEVDYWDIKITYEDDKPIKVEAK